jgi:hypothetical protein
MTLPVREPGCFIQACVDNDMARHKCAPRIIITVRAVSQPRSNVDPSLPVQRKSIVLISISGTAYGV